MAEKTVTLKAARPGRTGVRVDEYLFTLGKPVRNVPEEVVERLVAMPGVQAHITASSRAKSESPSESTAEESTPQSSEDD